MDPDTLKRIQRIEQKGQSLERSIGSLKTFLRGDEVDPINAEMRLEHIKPLFKEYVHNHEELKALQADNPRVVAFDQIEADYFAIYSTVHKLKAPVPLANSTVLGGTNVTFTERHDTPRFSQVEIPSFDGRHENWTIWKNNFQALIHDRADVSAYVKHTHLQTAAQGLAELVIKEFTPSEVNYPLAWDALCKAYDQPRVIINKHIDKLLALPKLTEAKPDSLAELMYTVRHRVKLLEALGETMSNAFVIRLLERSLPSSVTSRWVDRVSDAKTPNVEELYTFVQTTIFKLRQMSDLPTSGGSAKKRAGGHQPQPPPKNQRMGARTLVTSGASNINCLACDQSHRLYLCPKFNNLKIKERWDIVKLHNLCRNCLYLHNSSCSSTRRCKRCQKEHHTLLHSDKKPKAEGTPSAKKSNTAGESKA